MKGPWVKLWRSFLSDPTIQLLMKRNGNGVVTLLVTLMTNCCNGVVETPEDELAFLAQMDDQEWANLVDKVAEKGLIFRDEDGKINFKNWDKYQQSDSAERVRKHRDKSHSVTNGNVTSPLQSNNGNGDVTGILDIRSKKIEVEEEYPATAVAVVSIPSVAPPKPKPEPKERDPLRDALAESFKAKVPEYANPARENANLLRLSSAIRRKAGASDVPEETAARGTVETFWRLHETGKPFYSDFTPSKMLAILESLWGEWAKGRAASDVSWLDEATA